MTSTRGASPSRANWLPYVVAATFFMEYLDTTVIATALPQMAHSFGVGPNALSLGMTAYMLALAVFIPASGWVADRFGSRSVYFTAISVFMVASVLCGLSNGVWEFTLARLLQGLGGALMVPVGRLVVVRSTEKSRLMQAISTITWPAIAAPVIGPPVGGFITTYTSWRLVFLLNVPFALAALAAVAILVPNYRSEERRPLDVTGLILSGVALSAILFGAELASQPAVRPLLAVAVLAGGVLIGVMAVRHARGHPSPLVDYSTLKIPTFSVTVLTGSLTRIGMGAVPYLLPLMFQIGFGYSAFHSGMLLFASATGNLGMKALTSRILRRYGFRYVAATTVAIGGLFIVACGTLTPHSPLAWTLLAIFIYGVARSMQFSLLATLAYADVGQSLMSAANSLWSAAAQMTIALGIAFGAVSLRFAAQWNDETGTHIGQHFSLLDFRLAFLFAGLLTLISIYGYLRLPADAGANIGGAQGATTRRNEARG